MFRIAYSGPKGVLIRKDLLYNYKQYNNCMCMKCNSVGVSSVTVFHVCSPPTSR